MLVNRSFGLIKNHQGSKGKVSQEPGLVGGQCSALSTGAGECCYPRELLRTVFNHFSSNFWVVHLTSASHLCAGTYPAASLVFPRQGGQGEPPVRPPLCAAPRGAAEYNLSSGECALAGAGFPGICLDTYLGTLRPAWQGGRK